MEVLNEELRHLKGKAMEGVVYKSTKDGDFKVIEYNDSRNVLVDFISTGYRTTVLKDQIIKGNIKDKLKPSVFSKGYMGDGNYKSNVNGKYIPAYRTWQNMLKRCYCPLELSKRPTYKDCSVHNAWLNYQTFAEWYHANYIEGYALDKDLKMLNNKVYSASTCSFVDQRVNNVLSMSNKMRGGNPVGVYYNKRDKKYRSECSVDGRKVHIGYYDTAEEAHEAYLSFKINEVKRVANEYKDTLDSTVYNNLVNITKEQLLTLAEA